jgi:hypothetical protein
MCWMLNEREDWLIRPQGQSTRMQRWRNHIRNRLKLFRIRVWGSGNNNEFWESRDKITKRQKEILGCSWEGKLCFQNLDFILPERHQTIQLGSLGLPKCIPNLSYLYNLSPGLCVCSPGPILPPHGLLLASCCLFHLGLGPGWPMFAFFVLFLPAQVSSLSPICYWSNDFPVPGSSWLKFTVTRGAEAPHS